VKNSQTTGSTKNAEKPQNQRIKHMSTCSNEAVLEPQPISIRKHDEKKNGYIRGRRNTMKTNRLKTGGIKKTASN